MTYTSIHLAYYFVKLDILEIEGYFFEGEVRPLAKCLKTLEAS